MPSGQSREGVGGRGSRAGGEGQTPEPGDDRSGFGPEGTGEPWEDLEHRIKPAPTSRLLPSVYKESGEPTPQGCKLPDPVRCKCTEEITQHILNKERGGDCRGGVGGGGRGHRWDKW